MPAINSAQKFSETARAFDRVASEYDGALGNNALVQKMRARLIEKITREVPRGARLLDLGCGTGLDALDLAQRGYAVTAIDSARGMIERTRARINKAGVQVTTFPIGIHELEKLNADPFDAIYSNLGPLNCVADLRAVAQQCARVLNPRGKLIASVIGRYCPWEIALYAARGNFRRAFLRWTRDRVPVPLGDETIWTRYYSPREFYRAFETEFELSALRALALFMPPPYLVHAYARHRALFAPLEFLDNLFAGAPRLQNCGDHFLITLTKR
ncbi:MAG: methyltransferase domain-containing protein [Chloroflexi bacterium]|nr:methyltransferase domain-containing protein [Chloroflexota bacterium]